MRAEIVSVGTELLLGQIVDTNAAYLAGVLSHLGISIYRRTTVGDNHDRLLMALQLALDENDVVITIGGLGPTMDDITRETLAEAIGDTLENDPEIARRLTAFFRSRKIEMPERNLRQALRPAHGRFFDNPNGTAPGLLFERGILAFGRTDGHLHNHFHYNPWTTPEENAERAAARLHREKPALYQWIATHDHNHIPHDFEFPEDQDHVHLDENGKPFKHKHR